MAPEESLAAVVTASPNKLSRAAYVTSQREYVRYYIASRRAPHAIVLYVDASSGEITDSTARYEQELLASRVN